VAITGEIEHGFLTRQANVDGNPVLRVDLDDWPGYNEITFDEAGSGVGTDPLTIDNNGHLYFAGKKHSRDYTNSVVTPMPAARTMKVAIMHDNAIPDDYSAIVVGIGSGVCAVHKT